MDEAKLFVEGRVSIGDDPAGKLVCEKIIPFDDIPKELWVQFEDKDSYLAGEKAFLNSLKMSEGRDSVVVYLKKEKAKKVLPSNWNVKADKTLLSSLSLQYGEKNIKLVEKLLKR